VVPVEQTVVTIEHNAEVALQHAIGHGLGAHTVPF